MITPRPGAVRLSRKRYGIGSSQVIDDTKRVDRCAHPCSTGLNAIPDSSSSEALRPVNRHRTVDHPDRSTCRLMGLVLRSLHDLDQGVPNGQQCVRRGSWVIRRTNARMGRTTRYTTLRVRWSARRQPASPRYDVADDQPSPSRRVWRRGPAPVRLRPAARIPACTARRMSDSRWGNDPLVVRSQSDGSAVAGIVARSGGDTNLRCHDLTGLQSGSRADGKVRCPASIADESCVRRIRPSDLTRLVSPLAHAR